MERTEHHSEQELQPRKLKAWVEFGLDAHEKEYVFNVEHLAAEKTMDVPSNIIQQLEELIGADWEIIDRGTRVEIRNRKEYGRRDDEIIRKAVEQAIGDKFILIPVKE